MLKLFEEILARAVSKQFNYFSSIEDEHEQSMEKLRNLKETLFACVAYNKSQWVRKNEIGGFIYNNQAKRPKKNIFKRTAVSWHFLKTGPSISVTYGLRIMLPALSCDLAG